MSVTTSTVGAAPPRVLQVSVGNGGVPKLPVDRARVGRLGLEGDRQREVTMHGGPFRAVCLFGIEVIERLRAEGHPVGPGATGENLTTQGVEWSELPPGTRVRVGSSVLLELTTSVTPCKTQRPNFLGGRFSRISILAHPSDSRMYARVLEEGAVKPGDAIELLPPEPASEGALAPVMQRIDRAEQESDLRLWRAAEAAGYDISILDDGELSVAAAPELPGPAFNHAVGLRALPHLLPRALEHFRARGATGWLAMYEPPWEDATPDFSLAILRAEPPIAAPGSAEPDRAYATVRPIESNEARERGELIAPVPAAGEHDRRAALAENLLAMRNVHYVVAERAGRAVGIGGLHVHGKVGFLRAAVVEPEARGQGIHASLIAARAALAARLGCDLLAAHAIPRSISERNLRSGGFERLAVRDHYRFQPTLGRSPTDAPSRTP